MSSGCLIPQLPGGPSYIPKPVTPQQPEAVAMGVTVASSDHLVTWYPTATHPSKVHLFAQPLPTFNLHPTMVELTAGTSTITPSEQEQR